MKRIAVPLIAALVAAGSVAATHLTAQPFPAVGEAGAGAVLTDASTQAWYCALGTGASGGQGDATVVLTNSGAAPLHGSVSVFVNSSGGPAPAPPATRDVALGPYSRGSVRLGDIVSSTFVAARVLFSGPRGAAELQVSGPLGLGVVPCAGAPSPDWYFAAGTTKQGASLVLGLFNPFPEDAIADLSFADEGGYSAPPAFQGVYVPARSLVAVDVGAHVVEQADIATAVSVRVGRLVAGELQLDTISGESGINVVTGAPTATSQWFLPDGVVQAGLDEQLHVYDPGTAAARVSVSAHLAQGQAAPFDLAVAPHSQQVLDLAGQPRLPPGDDFTLDVKASGAPVVVERTVHSTAPSPRRGSAQMLGAASAGPNWLVAAGGATSAQDEYVTIVDPGSRPARVSIGYLEAGTAQPLPGLGPITVNPGTNSHVRVGQYLSLADLAVTVDSDQPIVVERDLFQVGSPGLSLSIGIPVG